MTIKIIFNGFEQLELCYFCSSALFLIKQKMWRLKTTACLLQGRPDRKREHTLIAIKIMDIQTLCLLHSKQYFIKRLHNIIVLICVSKRIAVPEVTSPKIIGLLFLMWINQRLSIFGEASFLTWKINEEERIVLFYCRVGYLRSKTLIQKTVKLFSDTRSFWKYGQLVLLQKDYIWKMWIKRNNGI